MSTRDPQRDLHDLLQDAVADVEPADRLAAIRARTATARRARPWWYAAGAVAVATAAAVVAVAVVTGPGARPGPAGHHGEHGEHGQHDLTATDPVTSNQLVAVYFVGGSPRGPRLYREFDAVLAGDPLAAALDRLQRPATDPDYQVSWPPGTLASARLGDGAIDVELGDVDAGFQAEDLATQAVVYTLQAVAGERLPVRFLRDGEVVLGPVDALPELDVLNPVSIADPVEGTAYVGPDATMLARGRASSFEANVPWEVRDDSGTVVRRGFATADGWQDRLYPWQASIDLSGLPDGFYTFTAMTDDPSGEGRAFTDTRRIIVR